MIRTKTFTVTYNYFEPGTYVVPTSPRSVLTDYNDLSLFKVTECLEPAFEDEVCIVFVEGHRYGVDTEYLREATLEEVMKGLTVHTKKLKEVCHYCFLCGGWIKGEPHRNKPTLSGRQGTVEYCQRCSQEINFLQE